MFLLYNIHILYNNISWKESSFMPKLNKQQIKEMDEIIKNYKDRIVSRPIDLDEALKQNKKPE